jgi:hypothetical protein
VHILGQLNPVHIPTYHFLKIHFNDIILPSTPRSPQWSLSLRFSHQNPAHASLIPHTPYMPRPSHSRFYHPHNATTTDDDYDDNNKPVIIVATGTISKSFRKYLSTILGNHDVRELQKIAILGTAYMFRKVLM